MRGRIDLGDLLDGSFWMPLVSVRTAMLFGLVWDTILNPAMLFALQHELSLILLSCR